MPALARILTATVIAMLSSPALAVGFQYLSIPDDTGRPIEIGIWYPSKSETAPTTVGMVAQNVALDGEVDGESLPVVILSHGSAGFYGERVETATDLADAGFVAVSMTYPGDNHKDAGDRAIDQLIKRPRVTSQVLDYVTQTWPQHDHVDASEIGFYGFSAGGFTGLVSIGGVPDWSRFPMHCKETPSDGACKQGSAAFFSSGRATSISASEWHHDPRIKAAVLVSPGNAFAFDPASLAKISIPVELWGGSEDEVVQFASNIGYLEKHIPQVVSVHEVDGAGHYSFLRACSDSDRTNNMMLCADRPGFDRAAFQKNLNRELVQFFRSELEKTGAQ